MDKRRDENLRENKEQSCRGTKVHVSYENKWFPGPGKKLGWQGLVTVGELLKLFPLYGSLLPFSHKCLGDLSKMQQQLSKALF